MMRRKLLLFTLIFSATFVCALSTTWATLFRVTLDLTSSTLDFINLPDRIFGSGSICLTMTLPPEVREHPMC